MHKRKVNNISLQIIQKKKDRQMLYKSGIREKDTKLKKRLFLIIHQTTEQN